MAPESPVPDSPPIRQGSDAGSIYEEPLSPLSPLSPNAAWDTSSAMSERIREDDIDVRVDSVDRSLSGREYSKHLNSQTPGTGSWLLEHSAFKAWKEAQTTESSCLAITGVSGSGKSVLAAHAIRHIQETEPGVPVLFFFSSQRDHKNGCATCLTSHFAKQLLETSPILLAKLDHLMNSLFGVRKRDTIWSAVVEVLAELDKVYWVVDGLDIIDEQLSNVISRLIEVSGRKIRVLFTGRPDPTIENLLRETHAQRLELEASLVTPDIDKFIRMTVGSHKLNLSQESQGLVGSAICRRADGVFLYARLMTDSLAQDLEAGRVTETGLPAVLDGLPVTVDDAYERILAEQSKRSGLSTKLQSSILMFVIYSLKSLRLIELESLAAHIASNEGSKEETDLVRASCGPLLEMSTKQTVNVFHPSFQDFLCNATRAAIPGSFPVLEMESAHAEMTILCLQYLDGCPAVDVDFFEPSVDVGSAGSDKSWAASRQFHQLAKTCRFLEYASYNLFLHCKKGGNNISMMEALDECLNPERPAFRICMLTNWSTGLTKTFNAMHLASREGLTEYVRHLASTSPTLVDASDGAGRTPLSFASENGHADIVKILLTKGASVGSDCADGLMPLHYATKEGHLAVVQLLLDAGASPLATKTRDTRILRPGFSPPRESDEDMTALEYACQKGHTDIMELFLPRASPKEATRCLHWVKGAENVEAVLATGRAVVDSFKDGRTKLFEAAAHYDHETIKVLLSYGADPNKRCQRLKGPVTFGITTTLDAPMGPTPMHAFAAFEDDEFLSSDLGYSPKNVSDARTSLRLLLDAGGDPTLLAQSRLPEDRDGGYSLLHFAVQPRHGYFYDTGNASKGKMQAALVDMLIKDAGADPNVRSSRGRRPLHLVDLWQPEPIEALIKNGADVNATSNDGLSPLLAFSRPFHLWHRYPKDEAPDAPYDPLAEASPDQALEAFSKYGADVNIPVEGGNTLLHVVFLNLDKFREDRIPFLRSLARAGADFNRRNDQGLVPLHAIRFGSASRRKPQEDEEAVLQVLVEEGMDINVRDVSGRTILSRLVEEQDMDRAALFTRLGAQLGDDSSGIWAGSKL